VRHIFVILIVSYFFQLSAFRLENLDEGKLKKIHKSLELLHGSFEYEYPEQLLVATYLDPDAKVLELGSNLGSNSLVIAKLLKDSRNFVTLETRSEYIPYLKENRDHNNLSFHIENSAVSKVPLYQKGWITSVHGKNQEGFFKVNTLSFDELQNKYDIRFDTLVIDIEGAFYQMLKEVLRY
jgi:FkbM family methyltransferase